jgi:hypothetical protein
MHWWKVTLHNAGPVQVEAPDAFSAISQVAGTIKGADIKAVICLSESATKRSIFQKRLGAVSNHVWTGYREAERLLLFVTEQFPDETQAKAKDLLRALKTAGSVVSELHGDKPK